MNHLAAFVFRLAEGAAHLACSSGALWRCGVAHLAHDRFKLGEAADAYDPEAA
jgi:hypothetical protein